MTKTTTQAQLTKIEQQIDWLNEELADAPNGKVHTPWWNDRLKALIGLTARRRTLLTLIPTEEF